MFVCKFVTWFAGWIVGSMSDAVCCATNLEIPLNLRTNTHTHRYFARTKTSMSMCLFIGYKLFVQNCRFYSVKQNNSTVKE